MSVMSVLVKITGKMVSARLNWYLETQNILSLTQAGFRRCCSTNQQIGTLIQEIKDRKKIMLLVFVDFKSAYESVWRVKRMKKLQTVGVKGRMLNIRAK
jgi:hypothetical protein